MAVSQLDLLDAIPSTLCNYGQPEFGAPRPCERPATHRARWLIPSTYLDGTPNSRAGEGGIECCREHANYYASAWVNFDLYPYSVDAWIDIL